ncbi:MAG: hypothetical protein QM786_07915 [Breznakibacter sp.]
MPFFFKLSLYFYNRSSTVPFSIDYLIGEENYLQKGYGKEIVKLLVGKIHELSDEIDIVVQPENENTASCKALLANDFVYDETKKYYILKRK